jgi:hypothetical protein
MGEPWSQYVIQVVMKIGLTCIRVYGVCSRQWKKPVLAVVPVSRPVCSGDRCILYSAGVFMLWPEVCVVDGSSSQGGSVSRVSQLWCWCCMARRNAPTAIECCYLVFPNESRPISVVMECKGAE